jgi:REP element-mobilizing transposase RayT
MARKLRVQYPGAIYHVMNRGDRREAIFCEDSDWEFFEETLGQACEKTDWRVHAWCFMSNHFHLVVETPKANLVAGMKWLLGTYTSRRGWCYGSPEFRLELLERMAKGLGKHHGGPERQETAIAKAERLLAEELRRRKVRLEDLAERPKGDRQKARIALWLREETTMTWDWIAEKLAMGVGPYAAFVFGYSEGKEKIRLCGTDPFMARDGLAPGG